MTGIIEELSHLGLSTYEQAVYQALLKCGTSTAKNIAAQSLVPPTAVYPNLKSLIVMGLIQKIDSDPAQYFTIDPKISLFALAKRRSESILDASSSVIPKLLSLVTKGVQGTQREPASVSLGLEASHQITKAISSRAHKSIFVSGWGFNSQKNIHNILSHLGDHAEAGKDVRLLLRDKDSLKLEPVRACMKRGVKIRVIPIIGLSIVVGDAKECKITLKNPELGNRVNLHVKDESLSKYFHSYFCEQWKKAKKV